MTIDISYNSHSSGLSLYAIVLDKSLNIYSQISKSFITSSDIAVGKISLIEGKFSSYQSSIDSSSFKTGSYIIKVYEKEADQDSLLHVSEFNWDEQLQREVDSLDNNYYLPELLSYSVDQIYIIKVVSSGSGNVFQINDSIQPKIALKRGGTYRFDQSNISNGDTGYSQANHPLIFSTTSDGHHNGGERYSDGVVYPETYGNLGSYTIFRVPLKSKSRLYYHCHNHTNMGGVIDITGGNINEFGNNTIGVISTRGNSSSSEVKIIAR